MVARDRRVPIRIGVNAGSLPGTKSKYNSVPRRMISAALKQIKLLESYDFDLIKVSLKAFDVPTTVEAYRLIAPKIPYPLHLGITEAGLPGTGIIRSAVGIGILLFEGIGDTIRVSLSAHPREEIVAAFEILKSLNIRRQGPTLISCPSCGRCEVDIIKMAETVAGHISNIKKPITIAVMGCVVNGPGEAKEADVGIACGKGKGAIFKKGLITATVAENLLVDSLLGEINSLLVLD